MAKPASIAPILEATHRRRWAIIVVFLATIASGVSFVWSLPPLYEASAKILVEGQQIPPELVRSMVTNQLNVRLQTINERVLSRSSLIQVIEAYDLYRHIRGEYSMEEVVDRMRRDVHFRLTDVQGRGSASTIAFEIGYRGPNREKVAQVANNLASQFIDQNLQQRVELTADTATFLESELGETEADLRRQEKRISIFKEKNLGELPEQMDALLSNLDRLNDQLSVNAEKQSRAREQKALYAKELIDLGEALGAGSVDPSQSLLSRHRAELADLRSKYTDRHPAVRRLQREIDALEAKIDAGQSVETLMPPNPYVFQLQKRLAEEEAEIRALLDEEGRLKAQIADTESHVEKIPQREQELQSLLRDYQSTKEHYETLLKRHKEAVLAKSMEERQKGEKFRILDPATVARRPIAPHRIWLTIGVTVMAIGCAVGAAALREQLDTTFHGVDDLREFANLPVLADIPRIVTPADRRSRWIRTAAGVVGSAVLVAALAGGSWWIAHENDFLVKLLA